MKTFENIFRLHRLLRASRHPVSLKRIREALECSERTAHRTIGELRDFLGAPIEHQRSAPAGYRYTDTAYELPGLWFSATEIQALLVLQQLLQSFEPGLLDDALEPLRRRLDQILVSQGLSTGDGARIRLLKIASRKPGAFFNTVATAVLQQKRLSIRYDARSTGRCTLREVSPLRMIHYRDNWYLDAWCHKQNALRTFALDCIESATPLDVSCVKRDDSVLDRELGSSYGIISGVPTSVVRMRFTPLRARWVAREQWHPDQKGWYDESGHYMLELPYSRSNELILDILRYGPDVEVIAPLDLRKAVADRLREALAQYA
jgi:predicted DNA-binding transcriptional regulator YafY